MFPLVQVFEEDHTFHPSPQWNWRLSNPELEDFLQTLGLTKVQVHLTLFTCAY